MSYTSVTTSPNVVVPSGASQLLLSPADSSSFVNAAAAVATPFSTNNNNGGVGIGVVGPFVTTPVVDNANASIVVDSTMTVPASNQLYYYSTPGQTTAPSAAAVLTSASWPPTTNPTNSFDLGYVSQNFFRKLTIVEWRRLSFFCYIFRFWPWTVFKLRAHIDQPFSCLLRRFRPLVTLETSWWRRDIDIKGIIGRNENRGKILRI